MRALLDQFLYLILEFAGDDISGGLAPVGFGDLLLHALDARVLLLQCFADLDQVAGEAFFLRLHVLADVLLALLEGLVDDEQQSLPQVLELVGDHPVHAGVEVLDLYVDVGDLVPHLHAQVVQALLRLDARGLETSTVRHQPRPDIVLPAQPVQPVRPVLGHTRSLIEVVQRVEPAVLEGGALAEVVGLEGDEAGVGGGFEGGEGFGRRVGACLVFLVVFGGRVGAGLVVLEVGLSGLRFGGGELAFGEFVLRPALALALPRPRLRGRVGEQGVLLQEGQQVVVGVAHRNKIIR